MSDKFNKIYDHSIKNPEKFWQEAAEDIFWFKKPTKILNKSNPPFYKWFEDGVTNTCYNALDHHIDQGRGEKLAIIYDSPITGAKNKISYKELRDRVALFAGALKKQGVNKGDRVIIYMPMIPEAAIAMLACGRIGAVHSVVFGGFASNELASRIDDSKAKLIISASCGYEPGRTVHYKPLVNKALELASHKPKKCIIFQRAKDKADAAFEFITKMGFDFFCFHDIDLVDEAPSLAETEKRLERITEYVAQKQKASGVELLWGTANCFSNPSYMNGAATNPDFNVVARAGAQIKLAIDATISLNGQNYVFWGGREGYMSLLNTDMGRELDHMAQMLSIARDYARKQGFKGTFFIEPKPMEPMKHQYDFDAATAIGFLQKYGLDKDFKLNIEVNHATLAQHTFEHELEVAANAGMLGSIDANRGDNQNGWDTDQFPNNINEVTEACLLYTSDAADE